MKTSIKPGRAIPKAVAALCVLSACATSSFAQQYPPSGPKPRVGTRFLNFVKDLVWGEEPDNRYRGYAPSPAPARQHSYGAQNGQRLNLDRPPAGAGQDEPQTYQRPVPPPPSQNHLSQQRDMPYTSPRQEQAPEPERPQQRREEVQEDPPTPKKQKPHMEERKVEETPPLSKTLFPKKSEPKKKVEESIPESKPDIQPLKTISKTTESPKQEPPVETQKETVVASNKDRSSSGSTSTAPASNAATLTGTKTTKAGLVKSPYAPYNELDVTGLPSGSLAMDPTTGKVFRVP